MRQIFKAMAEDMAAVFDGRNPRFVVNPEAAKRVLDCQRVSKPCDGPIFSRAVSQSKTHIKQSRRSWPLGS